MNPKARLSPQMKILLEDGFDTSESEEAVTVVMLSSNQPSRNQGASIQLGLPGCESTSAI